MSEERDKLISDVEETFCIMRMAAVRIVECVERNGDIDNIYRASEVYDIQRLNFKMAYDASVAMNATTDMGGVAEMRYLNTGHTYKLTVMEDETGKLRFTSWGDMCAHMEGRVGVYKQLNYHTDSYEEQLACVWLNDDMVLDIFSTLDDMTGRDIAMCRVGKWGEKREWECKIERGASIVLSVLNATGKLVGNMTDGYVDADIGDSAIRALLELWMELDIEEVNAEAFEYEWIIDSEHNLRHLLGGE